MIDFVAYHDLQAQCGTSIFNELSKTHDCQWRINPYQEYTGSDVLIMLDHIPHHLKLINKYKYSFHFPHDMGEFKVYLQEKEALKNYTAIFAPTVIHQSVCKELLPEVPCHLVGWPKYDAIRNKSKTAEEIIHKIKRLEGVKILCAPTNPYSFEWTELLPVLKRHGSVLVKNHILLNPGQKPPHVEGADQYNLEALHFYKTMFDSIEKMEDYASSQNMTVVPRNLNACELFEDVDVLVSDTSSLLAEFLPFGLSIETGRNSQSDETRDMTMSTAFPGIVTWSGYQKHLQQYGMLPIKPVQNIVKYDSRVSEGKQIADIIRGYIT